MMTKQQMESMTVKQHNEHINAEMNEELAQLLERFAKLYGCDIYIEDTDWQTVYDLKVEVINRLEELGITVEF